MPPEPACDEHPADSASHVGALWDYITRIYPEIKPSGEWSFGDVGKGNSGATDQWGDVTIDDKYASMTCLTSKEFNSLFGTVFHEMMHSTDGYLTRRWDIFGDDWDFITEHHATIHTRTSFERMMLRRPTGDPMWGYTEENLSRAKPRRNWEKFEDLLKETNDCECGS